MAGQCNLIVYAKSNLLTKAIIGNLLATASSTCSTIDNILNSTFILSNKLQRLPLVMMSDWSIIVAEDLILLANNNKSFDKEDDL
jgi:hypothetical protein